MDKNFVKWFERIVLLADAILLMASTPHIAAWFAHNDSQSNPWQAAYAWIIGYLVALAIDGTSVVLLYGLIGLFKSKKKAALQKTGLVLCIILLALLSTYINWLYDVQNATDAFAKADAITLHGMPLGDINPLIGGSFALLNIFYAGLSSLVQMDIQPAMTEQEFEVEKQRIAREQELKALRGSGNGLIASGREKLLGRGQTEEEKQVARLNAVVDFLTDAPELCASENEERALQALATLLKIRSLEVLPYLIRARSTVARMQQPAPKERDTDKLEKVEQASLEESPVTDTPSETDPLADLSGRDTVDIAIAAGVLQVAQEHVTRLVREGKLKHASNAPRKITVSSLRQYLAKRRPMNRTTQVMEAVTSDELGTDKLEKTVEALRNNPAITDEELATILGMSRPASARFWRLKAQMMCEPATA